MSVRSERSFSSRVGGATLYKLVIFFGGAISQNDEQLYVEFRDRTSKIVPVVQNWTISFRCQEFYAKVLHVHSHVYPSIETKVADANVIKKPEERPFSFENSNI